ncbi:MAG: helix-turn-helix transcriptional regulator [Waddliaceae bacterium]
MSKKDYDIEVYVGSGNVFEDLGFPNPQEALAKSELAGEIHQVIKSRKLTQKQAAEIMGIAQPKVSDIARGKLSKFTIDRLMRFLRLLGRDIEIRVKKHTQRSVPPTLQVVGVNPSKTPGKRLSA